MINNVTIIVKGCLLSLALKRAEHSRERYENYSFDWQYVTDF